MTRTRVSRTCVHKSMLQTDLQTFYDELNQEFFDAKLGACEIRWNRRLTSAAGNISVQKRLIQISIPLLCDSFEGGACYEVCGVLCDSPNQALREILKHEMIHLWLWEQKLPHGHTAAFRVKARQIGQPKTRHGIARPAPKSGWIYSCGVCQSQIFRRKRFGRKVACAACCRAFSGGKFDARFGLCGKRVVLIDPKPKNVLK